MRRGLWKRKYVNEVFQIATFFPQLLSFVVFHITFFFSLSMCVIIGIISGQVEVWVSICDSTPGLPSSLNSYMSPGKSPSLSFSACVWPSIIHCFLFMRLPCLVVSIGKMLRPTDHFIYQSKKNKNTKGSIAKICKQPKCPSVDAWIRKMWCVCVLYIERYIRQMICLSFWDHDITWVWKIK